MKLFQKRGGRYAARGGGEVQQKRDTLVGAALIFGADGKKHVWIAVVPVERQPGAGTVDALGEDFKRTVWSGADDAEGVAAPFVRVLQKEIGREAGEEGRAGRIAELAAAPARNRLGEARRVFVNRGFHAAQAVEREHIAVRTALAYAAAAVPWIPEFSHERLL